MARGNNTNNVAGFRGFVSRCAKLACFRRISVRKVFVGVVCVFCIAFLLLYWFGCKRDVAEFRKSFPMFGGENFGDLSLRNKSDYREDLKFESPDVLMEFQKESNEVNASVDSRNVGRLGYKKPKLALVFADLWADPHQIKMVTIAVALRELGYEIEVYSLEDGPIRDVWEEVGVPLRVIAADENMQFSVDWLNYNGILVNSLKAVDVLYSLMKEPFRNVPLVWTIHEQTPASLLSQYHSSEQNELVDNCRKLFNRPTAIVFPNYDLQMAYSLCYSGNYHVIPGFPARCWQAEKLMSSSKENPVQKIESGLSDFVVAVVGSQLVHKDLWRETALVLKALRPLLKNFDYRLKIIVVAGGPRSNYSGPVETIAQNLKYPNGTIKHIAIDEDTEIALINTDVVIYGSLLEERTFPDILLNAMCLEKPIIAPDLRMISKYGTDGINVNLFPKHKIKVLKTIFSQLISKGKLSPLARRIAAAGKTKAKNLMVSESVEGYASLLENILVLPSEVSVPKSAKDIPIKLKNEWQWRYFETFSNETKWAYKRLDKVEKQFTLDKTFMDSMDDMRKRKEEDELKERTQQTTWDERVDEGRRPGCTVEELLCIYEPYYGEGTWPFLHNTSLYRGISLSTEGRRPGSDDVDAPSRLPLLNDSYYRDVLGEYGAFFAIANGIDRIHKNPWIGFQSWRATARTKSLSKTAEKVLLNAIQTREDDDTFYFWASLDMDPRYQFGQDFWSFCDAINAGKCQHAFSETLKEMFGVEHDLSSLPPMPSNGTWSVMHSWVLSTNSFKEFVIFSRIFVDKLDALFYNEHRETGLCYLSLSKDNNCYSRILELLVNLWAYHTARSMVYVDPRTGFMKEQHEFKTRGYLMWVRCPECQILESLKQKLAEELNSDGPKRRWLWPLTGKVCCQSNHEQEKDEYEL